MGQSSLDSNRRYVGTKENVIYGIANGGQCLSYSFLTAYITYFFVNVFNIDSRIVATMLFMEGIWDAVNDPLMGTVVDKTRTRFGKLRPFLMGVPLPLAAATVMLFAGPVIITAPGTAAPSKLIYMVVTYFLWEFLYTICDVPFWGMSASISPNPADRTRAITSARFISGIIGGIPGILTPILIDLSNNRVIDTSLKDIFFGSGLVFGIFGMGLFFLSGIFIKERVVQSIEEPSFKDCIDCVIKNPPLRLIILWNMLGSLGGIGGIFSNYYFIDVLGSASASIIVGIPGAVISGISFLLVPMIKEKLNNKQIIIGSKIVGDTLSILMFVLGLRRYSNIRFMIPLMMVKNTLSAFLSGINSVVPTEMIGESVDYMEWTTGQRTEGMNFSILTFIGKFNNAIARSLGAFMISMIGYVTSSKNAIVPQSDKTKLRIWAMYTVIPALLGSLAYIPMFKYDLVGDKQKRMFDDLAKRRELLTIEVSK